MSLTNYVADILSIIHYEQLIYGWECLQAKCPLHKVEVESVEGKEGYDAIDYPKSVDNSYLESDPQR